MKGLDSNVLLRLMLGDDARQKDAARRYVARAAEQGVSGYVNLIVLCEIAWTLRRHYRQPGEAVAEFVGTLLQMREVPVQDEDLVAAALPLVRSGHDLADLLIAAVNRRAGCSATGTFDRDAASLAGFEAIPK